MAESKQNMRDSANFIVSTEADNSVSHQRVGKLFNDIIDWLGETPGGGGGSSYPSPSGSDNDVYLHWNGNSYNWQKPSGTAQLGGFLNSLNGFTQPTSVATGYLHYNGSTGNLEWTDIPAGSGITWTDLASPDNTKKIDKSHITDAFGNIIKDYSFWGNKFGTSPNTATAITGLIQADNGIRIGGANGVWLTYDSNNKALKVSDDPTAASPIAKNFYATGGVSALGYDASGGGGGGGGSFEPNDLVGSLNTKSGMPSEGQILVYRPDTLGGWSYEAKPTTGGEGGIDNIIFNGTEATLSNKTATIAQEKADWNANSGYAEILNKPTALRQFTDDLGDSPAHTHSQYAIASEMTTALGTKLNASEFNSFKTDTTWWGQHIGDVTAGKVEGDIEAGAAGGAITGFHSLELNTHNTAYQGIGGFIDFHVGGQQQGVPDYTARLIEDPLGILCVQSMTKEEKFQKAGLHVGQNFKDSFVQIGNVKLVYDGDSAIRVEKFDGTAAHLYATGGVSALGIQPEVTGLESFTISHLKSTDIEIAENTSIQDNDTDELKVITKNSEIKFTVNVNNYSDTRKPSLIVREEGIMAKNTLNGVNEPGIFYFDSNHWLYIDSSGNLKYHKGSEGDKTVVLQ